MSELLSDLDLDEPRDSRETSPPKTQRIEQAIVLVADAVWAVVGLMLWVPQIVRVVFTSAIRLVHAALTRQPIDGIRGPIRQVSRFYVDGFLSPGREQTPGSYGSRQPRLGRFLTEALWVALVWLAALRLVNEEAFATVWQFLIRSAIWLWTELAGLAQIVAEHLPDGLRVFANLGTGPSIALALVLVGFLAGGFILGRRSR